MSIVSAPEKVMLKPRVSEQTYEMATNSGVYVFDVPIAANKMDIKKSVEAQFKVSVTKVRTSTLNGKPVSSYRKRNRPVDGKRASVKKAYVTLAKGDKLAIFEEIK